MIMREGAPCKVENPKHAACEEAYHCWSSTFHWTMKWCCETLPGWVRVVEWTQQQSPNSRLPLCSVSPGIQICMQFTCYDIYFPLNTHKTLGGVIFSIFSWITLCNMPLEVQRVKGMSRSGEERLGLGVTTWPAGRSRGVITLQGVAKHLSADSSQ